MWISILSALLMVNLAWCELQSPCAKLFEYNEVTKPETWEGTLILQPDYTLHGVWTRIFFDKPVKEVKLIGDFVGEVLDNVADKKTEFLIKNREVTLKKKEPIKIKFSVSYEGSSPPALIGYRLNGRDVCPEDQD